MKQNTFLLVLLACIVEFFEQIAADADYCSNGHICPSPQKCCQTTCCLPEGYEHHYKTFRWSVWNMWYFWFVMIFVLMSCFGGCGYWRRRQLLLTQQHHAMLHSVGYNDLFNRRLRSLRNAAEVHAHQRHQMQHAPVNVYAGYESSYPPVASNFTRHAAPSNRGPPEGVFPQPPPYSEVAKDGEFSMYPPQYKDEYLPPYPGASYPNIDIGPSGERELRGVGESVPGLPPYSVTSSQSASGYVPSSQHFESSASVAHSSPANQCSSYSATPTSQHLEDNQGTPRVHTDIQRSTNFQRILPEQTNERN